MFIRLLRIARFRRFAAIEWQPSPGINCVIGPGDAGKSTLLAAVELLLSPRPFHVLSEYDFFERKVADGFEISAVLGGASAEVVAFASNFRVPPICGWKNGKLREAPTDGADPVIALRVRGTPDLEVEHVVVTPSGEELSLSTAMRRKLGFAHLGGADRGQQDLRLGRGTLLAQHVAAEGLRAGLVDALARASDGIALPDDTRETLKGLGDRFAAAGLPASLALGLLTPRGESLVGLLGLVSGGSPATSIPLAFHGLGTRQLANFELAHGLVEGTPIVILDEPELGLEPYRQRHLIERVRALVGDSGQAFVCTHSPAVLGTLRAPEVSRVRGDAPLRLDVAEDISELLGAQPEVFLSRLPVLCEGVTEAGLLDVLLAAEADKVGVNASAVGIHIAARTGQPRVLRESCAMSAAGIEHGLFVDAENDHSGLRERAAGEPYCTLASWTGVRNIEEIVARDLPIEHLSALVAAAAQATDRTVESLHQQLAEKAGAPGASSPADLVASLGEAQVRAALAGAMQAKQGRAWFKSRDGGRILARFIQAHGPLEAVDELVRDLWTALRNRLAV